VRIGRERETYGGKGDFNDESIKKMDIAKPLGGLTINCRWKLPDEGTVDFVS